MNAVQCFCSPRENWDGLQAEHVECDWILHGRWQEFARADQFWSGLQPISYLMRAMQNIKAFAGSTGGHADRMTACIRYSNSTHPVVQRKMLGHSMNSIASFSPGQPPAQLPGGHYEVLVFSRLSNTQKRWRGNLISVQRPARSCAESFPGKSQLQHS